ncbi:MAG: DUF2306 domain-containing protein [Asticcacaulis sp.]
MSFLDHFAHPHWPHLGLLGHVSPVILIHMFAALAAFTIGTIQIFGPKGTTMHRILGWSWVIIMFTVAGSSFFIHSINRNGFSLIHILSLVTLIFLPVGVYAARAHKIDLHKKTMRNLYIGALVIAGLFTFFPGRLIWSIFFG